ncbi:hypothetical protein PPYR_01045 [Photinus pyralis]|uniref:DUF4806 domain-containing protein n=1 Tax=Photinus pyralis TaxID=7054 RepID=A0A5N4B3C2_PHOPY|nr:hypothetical protein PPYR_01045 [Photinus pyralis]
MYKLFNNAIGMTFSWDGAKGKKKFKQLKLASVIIDSVRLNKRTQQAADDEIIKIIKSWLVRAKDIYHNSNRASNLQQTVQEEAAADNL